MKDSRSQIDKLMNIVRDVFDKHGIKMSMRNARLHAMYLYGRGCRVQVEGEWLERVEYNSLEDCEEDFYQCSVCGLCTPCAPNFCMDCGAKMKGGESE